jgi:hypothetical protein
VHPAALVLALVFSEPSPGFVALARDTRKGLEVYCGAAILQCDPGSANVSCLVATAAHCLEPQIPTLLIVRPADPASPRVALAKQHAVALGQEGVTKSCGDFAVLSAVFQARPTQVLLAAEPGAGDPALVWSFTPGHLPDSGGLTSRSVVVRQKAVCHAADTGADGCKDVKPTTTAGTFCAFGAGAPFIPGESGGALQGAGGAIAGLLSHASCGNASFVPLRACWAAHDRVVTSCLGSGRCDEARSRGFGTGDLRDVLEWLRLEFSRHPDPERVLDKAGALGLNQAQRLAVEAALARSRPRLLDLERQLAETAAPGPDDAAKIDAYERQVAELRRRIGSERLRANLETRAILKASQIEKLRQLQELGDPR